MKIENRSSNHRLTVLKPLVEFALARAGTLATLARIEFRDAGEDETCYGLAEMQADGGTCMHPSKVTVWLSWSEDSIFPYTHQYVQELEPICFESWTEEALVVIAHELRHIVQFWDESNLDAHVMEVDAEAFAIECLNAWRNASAIKQAA